MPHQALRTSRVPVFSFRCLLAVSGALVLSVPHPARANGYGESQATIPGAQNADVDRRMARLEEAFQALPILQAVKKADPQEYESFLLTIRQGVTDQVAQPELDDATARFIKKMTQQHLRRAAPAVLKQYLQARYALYEQIGAASLEALYVYVTTGTLKADTLSEAARQRLQSSQQNFSNGNVKAVTEVITARPADKPLRQDEAAIEKAVRAIYQAIPPAELEASVNKETRGVNRAAYANVLLRFYREALKRSDKDAVMVFRAIKELPPDDRAAAP